MFIAGISMFLGTPVAAWLMRRLDVRIVLGIGLTMFGVSLWWMGTLTTNSGFADFIMPQGLRGASVLFVMLPANQLALGRLPTHCVKNASSLYNLMRNLGGAGPSLWIPYVLVRDVDASAAKAESLGAEVTTAPEDIPGIGRYAMLRDPQGARLAVFLPNR